MRKLLVLAVLLISLTGCNAVISSQDVSSVSENGEVALSSSDLDATYSATAGKIDINGEKDIEINKGGTYVLSGTLNGSVIVRASKEEEVRLVLEGVAINSGNFAGIYIVEADKVIITLAENSVNSISDSGAYTQIDSNEVDALIYSKADLTINGTGSLKLNSSANHGIVSKDDLIIVDGNYDIDVAGVGMKGKDLLSISNGSFNIVSGEDGLKSDNDEDEDRGQVIIENGEFVINSTGDAIYGYRLVEIKNGNFEINTTESAENTSFKAIKSDSSVIISDGTFSIDAADDAIHSDVDIEINGGNFTINTADDAIHADSKLTINNGTFSIQAHEGLEATYILINDGTLDIYATDDGMNAAQKVNTYTPTVEMNGGNVTINMGQGDTDGIDSNGYIYINGGTLTVNAQNSFDAQLGQEHNGGTVIVNGEEVDELPEDMMAGMGGPMGNEDFREQGHSGVFNTEPGSETWSFPGGPMDGPMGGPRGEKEGMYFYPKEGEEESNNYFTRDN